MKYCGLLFFFLLSSITGVWAGSVDSLVKKLKPKPIFALDARNTRVLGESVQISGVKIGVELQDRLRFGLGYYRLSSSIIQPQIFEGKSYDSRFRMGYFSAHAEYAFYQSYRWELRVPIQAGMGISRWQAIIEDRKRSFDHGFIFMVEPAFSGHYRIWKWIGLAGELGYRQMIFPGTFNTQGLSGPFISFKLKIFLGDLYREVFRKEGRDIQKALNQWR